VVAPTGWAFLGEELAHLTFSTANFAWWRERPACRARLTLGSATSGTLAPPCKNFHLNNPMKDVGNQSDQNWMLPDLCSVPHLLLAALAQAATIRSG